jgi:type II secretory pathway pseudopilin PulG
MKRQSRRQHGEAFTIVELIVLTAVGGMLLLAAFNAVARCRADARAVHCESALRTLAVALHVYADGEKEFFPPHYLDNRKIPWHTNAAFRSLLSLDPKARTFPPELLCPERPESRKLSIASVYGQNITNVPVQPTPTGGNLVINRSEIDKPDAKVMLIDANDWSVRSGSAEPEKNWDATGEKTSKEGGKNGVVAYRHQQTAGVVQFDLSVRMATKDDLAPKTSGKLNKPAVQKIWELYTRSRKPTTPAPPPAATPTPPTTPAAR